MAHEMMETAKTLTALSAGLAEIADAVLPSLVQVRSGRHGVGSGVIWRNQGLILTNAHLLSRRKPTVRVWDGRHAEAEVVAVDKENDVALLRVPLDRLSAIQSGDSRALRAGELVMSFGHPWGIAGAATAGVVISTGNSLADFGETAREWIAAGLHLRPGHSGGPMVDSRGRLVGINTLMNGPEVGAAVPLHVAERLLV